MDVIDRYLRTLRILLPKDQRDDVLRELSEEMQSQVAEKEAALGRRLTAGEQAAIVSSYGHPLLTAARYRPQRHLIGPVVFPYYWIVLRIALALVASGGPFPYDRDGAVFRNREGILPDEPRGYYREYTVATPGSDDRGARRIVAGARGERYYTDDHYSSFRRIGP